MIKKYSPKVGIGLFIVIFIVVVALLAVRQSSASFYGRYGFSGNPSTNSGQTCTTCHTSGAAVPTLSIIGPTAVEAGSSVLYTVEVQGGPAQTAGISVSMSDFSGLLLAVDSDLKLERSELTHIEPKPFTGDTAAFTFRWSVPNSSGIKTMYVAVNSSNGESSTADDGIAVTTMDIEVMGGDVPTLTPIPTLPPVSALYLVADPIATEFDAPVAIANAGDERLFVVERSGRIALVDGNGEKQEQPFLDITSRVESGGEMGLLGLTFHPDYVDNGQFYVNYTAGDPRRTVVSRFTVSDVDPNTADPGSEEIVIEFEQPYTNHNAGDIQFGPDGYLYVTSGDGGAAGDPENNSQNFSNLLGGILRLDVDQESGIAADCYPTGNYTIPLTNGLRDGAGGDCDEFWVVGLRNPWRATFDSLTGDYWIGDVGQSAWEEVNVVPGRSNDPLNFGWRCYEGNDTYNSRRCASRNQYTFPFHAYDRSEGCSITGGFVYRGMEFPELYGRYFYTDFCQNALRVVSGYPDRASVSTPATGDLPAAISTFGVDSAGELYLASLNTGTVYRIISTDPPTPTPTSTPTATNTPLPTPTPTNTPTSTHTPSPTRTPRPTTTLTPRPTNTAVPQPTTGELFSDDFETYKGWKIDPDGVDTAVRGKWQIADPEGTAFSGDKQLGDAASGIKTLVTGAVAGSSVGLNDIDYGETSIRSPEIVLPTGATEIDLSFAYYLAHTQNSTADDYLRVSLVTSAETVIVFEESGDRLDDDAVWETATVDLSTYAGETVRLLIAAADSANGNIVEAAVDDILITATRLE